MPSPIHATAVAWQGAGVLLRGRSGSGKSDLALRLIDRGWSLVADDYVVLTPGPDGLLLSAPPAIAGLIEVRGVGLARLPFLLAAPLALVADLISEPPERLPETRRTMLEGVQVGHIRLRPFEASAPVRLEAALTLHRNNLL